MRVVIYYVLKNPEVHRKLRTALKELKPTFPISYDRAKDISYLNAVISEAIRFHPVVGLPLERVVPADGFRLPDGRYLPPGTIVGMNPWVLNLDHAVYGDDADQFVPERWLPRDDETTEEWEARKRKMQESILTFGAGNRVCKGKNAALMEMYKLTATLFCLYEVSDDS
jgi:cytochrome P450